LGRPSDAGEQEGKNTQGDNRPTIVKSGPAGADLPVNTRCIEPFCYAATRASPVES
jgi:hypothetical protein